MAERKTMDSRSRILNRIRQATGGQQADENIESAFQALCQEQEDTAVQPDLSQADAVSRFITEARRNGAQITEVPHMAEAVRWLQDQATGSDVAPTVSVSPGACALQRDWGALQLSRQLPEPRDSWGIVRAHSAIAETGTVVSLSRECPNRLLFLVERLIVLIEKKTIMRFQENIWERILQKQPLPRTVNLVTGPSRTADIEQQIQIGAHGPRRTDYLIVDSLPH